MVKFAQFLFTFIGLNSIAYGAVIYKNWDNLGNYIDSLRVVDMIIPMVIVSAFILLAMIFNELCDI